MITERGMQLVKEAGAAWEATKALGTGIKNGVVGSSKAIDGSNTFKGAWTGVKNAWGNAQQNVMRAMPNSTMSAVVAHPGLMAGTVGGTLLGGKLLFG